MAQMVKHLLTTWETRVQSLGQEDPLQKEMATHCVILAWGNLWERVERDLVTKQQQYLDDSSCHLHCQSHSGLER